jgi:SMODS and SLOG-associating 2TM effector domain 1
MTARASQLAELYESHRRRHQLDYYERTRAEYARAGSQLALVSGVLVIIGAAAGALAALDVAGWRTEWGLVAAIAPALGTALAAYDGLYGFDRNSKLYKDAVDALSTLPAPPSSDPAVVTAWCEQVEGVLRREQAQWGQLTEEANRAAQP